ncbi:ABC transporter substrate-binding protein [Phytohabitans sp. ZYX-F-186]|uniref:ABC transporter substrate-binding protein n=1 Tax=Phytohabitans maris TaxID=3071409 RepID=A0ABU0Z994_9ACTN|nr:ABC transporter substrate-binding protein [Phytohabitans sp. ZYX-F-186]MDQ7903599.1 ABC transporter substrate-binding protein [Phytohabitans sp. ZYX-F-186]
MRSCVRRGIAAAAAIVLLAVVGGCAGRDAPGGAGPAGRWSLAFADGAAKSSMASAVFLYGLEKGIFDRHGLDVEMTYVTPAAAQAALLAGDVDVAFDGDELMRAVGAAGRGKVFMTSGGMPFAIFSDEPLTVPGLRGRTISSTTPGSSFSSALTKTLRDAGLDPAKDVKIVYLQTVAAQYAALKAGTVDAVLLSPPTTVKARQEGLHKVADIADKTAPAVFAVTEGYLDANRPAVLAFVKAMAEATRTARDDPQGLADSFLKANPDLDAALVPSSFEEAAPRWEVSPYPEDWARTIMAASPDEKVRSVPLADFLDPSLVAEAGALAARVAA